MPGQTSKSALFAKYGAKLDGAVKGHASDPTDYGFVRLPGGITGGVAKLSECGFQQYKAGSNMKTASGKSAVGEWYWRAAGVVLEPFSVTKDGSTIPVRGLQTSTIIPVCETKDSKGNVTSTEEHIADILNEMRKIAGPEFTEGADGSNLESLCEQLKQAAPYFRFSTSQSEPTPEFPNPRVWENWHGSKGLEEYAPPSPQAGAAAQPHANGAPPSNAPTTAASGGSQDEDLDDLAKRATDGDDDANARLTELAKAVGKTEDEVSEAGSWDDVVAWIREGDQGSGDGAAASPEVEVGGTYKMTVIDPKTKKPAIDPKTKKARKPIEVEATAVDEEKRTATVKDHATKTTHKGVSFDNLESV